MFVLYLDSVSAIVEMRESAADEVYTYEHIMNCLENEEPQMDGGGGGQKPEKGGGTRVSKRRGRKGWRAVY